MSVSLKAEQNKHMVIREMLYIVEELTFMFLSRDALTNDAWPTTGILCG